MIRALFSIALLAVTACGGSDHTEYPPRTDSDGDGITDGADACPFQPETQNGFQDGDGCPDTLPPPPPPPPPPPADSDHDGIPDAADACPTANETTNGFQDADGCPDVDGGFANRWSGPVTLTIQGETPLSFTGTMTGAPDRLTVQFTPVCPLGDGSMLAVATTNNTEAQWTGVLACRPVAFSGGCSSVTFTFTGSAFKLNIATANLGAAGGGTASGCGLTKPFLMSFAGVRQ